MRRGHSGISGWRNENPRHFKPRAAGSPRFRPPRTYQLLEQTRFPPPGSRVHRGSHPFNTHSGRSDEHRPPDQHERNNYRNQSHYQNNPRNQDRGHQQRSRQSYTYINPSLNQDDNTQGSNYNHPSTFYNDIQVEPFHVNSLGDIDHRQLSNAPHNTDSYGPHRLNPWANLPPDQRHYEDRSLHKYYRNDTERQTTDASRIPSLDYTGHRPPSSDYYGSTSSTTINNNNTSFSRSVDDTVDIVRKRLMNRNDPQRLSQDASTNQTTNEQETKENSNQQAQQEPPTKKRIQRQRQNVKSNCDKMKTNIVHQLFKMDKDKMHKLMDDPGSSSKFEYAISSLITESQNSLNRHLRSVAEKSLVSTSSDFIHNDNNTIYEDTFMKQMQCLLDPQDTVLLEDIKPLVMAELSKVLQLDDFDARYDVEEQNIQNTRDEPQNCPNYENYNFDEYTQERFYNHGMLSNYEDPNRSDTVDNPGQSFNYNVTEVKIEENYQNASQLFERRPSKKSDQNQETRRPSVDGQKQRRSLDNPPDTLFTPSENPLPLFETSAEHLSEDDDPFAELDKQYHVAVDHNFLDDISARTTPVNNVPSVEVSSANIKTEIGVHLHSLVNTKSPLKIFTSTSTENRDDNEQLTQIKQEILQSPDFPKENVYMKETDNIAHREKEHINTKQEQIPTYKQTEQEAEKSETSNISKTSQSNSRKRSIDQRPSHRKEKRKKSESSSSEPKSSHRRDSTSSHNKSTEKCNETSKPYYSIFNSKDASSKEISKDNKRSDTTEKAYSDKYVKRKNSKEREKKDKEPQKKRRSSASSQTILSPKDSNNSISVTTPTKGDSKTKLKTIDMFVEQPKKVSLHQAHRNTAPIPIAIPKPVEENKNKPPSTCTRKQVQTKHASTQVIKRVISKETQTFESKTLTARFCQTESPKLISKGVQTPRILDKPKTKSVDALERMKEIDMEIQDLLQEKFKLYNNLESRDACPDTLSLGIAVVNYVDDNANDNKSIEHPDNTASADLIVEDFTSIPVEELEKIALESVDQVNYDDTKLEKRTARQRAMQEQRTNSESPSSTCSRRSTKRTKTPNISLIEQIITDDRPLEDIISLDDLESASPKHKKKALRPQSKKRATKRSKPAHSTDPDDYDIKECSVVILRSDISKYLEERKNQLGLEYHTATIKDEEPEIITEVSPVKLKSEIVEESVVNDLQFDMLDVSEDIVIGESCEIKDKDISEQTTNVSEELILDNSQSSADDTYSTEIGQPESECKTYDYSNDEELRRDSLTVTGNVDAVLAIECIETDFIAACLDGNVYHFSGDGQLLNTMRGSNLAVTCLTIVKEKYGTTVYTGSLDSRIRYYDLETGLEKGPECNVLSPIQTMDRAWDTVFVGTRTGFVLQFECKNNMLIPVSTVKFSDQAILALRAMKEGPRKVLLVASRSENVTVKDAQTGLLLRTLVGPKMTVYTLLFEDGKVYCGTSSHQIHVFDYASGTHTGCHEGGKGAVCLRATGGLVFAGCYDGCVYVYREGETRPLAQLRGPSLMLLSLAVVGSKIIAGYKDRSLYIWKIPLSILQEMIL